MDGPYAKKGTIEIEGAAGFLDLNFGQCAMSSQKVAANEMLITDEQNTKICNDNGLSAQVCGDPNPQIPLTPTAEQLCRFNSLPMSRAQELCAGQEVHGQDVFDDCVYDVCASAEEEAQLLSAEGSANEAQMAEPHAVCGIKEQDNCRPCQTCSNAIAVDLSNVVQNNLGGAGPDTGDEEIRYANAMTVAGQSVDVVLVAPNAYETPKPERNGIKAGDPSGNFGRFTIRTGTTTDMQFRFQ